MKKDPREPGEKPGAARKVVSIVGQIKDRQAKEARARALATHARVAELGAEEKERNAWVETLGPSDFDEMLAWCDEEGTPEARSSWADIRSLRALQSCLRGDVEAGRAEWAEVIAAEPNLAGPYLTRARWLSETDLPAALADCDRAVVADPQGVHGYARRGDYHRALGDPERALANYRRAIGIDPGLFDVHYLMGTVLSTLGKNDEAYAAYTRAIRLAPDYVEFYMSRGPLLERLDRHEEAAKDYARILELDPSRGDVAAVRREALFGKPGEIEASLAKLSDVIASMDPDEETHEQFTTIGAAYAAVGNAELALEAFDRALALQPNDASARAGRGRLRLQAGDFAGALEDFERASELAPDDYLHHLGRANALGKLGRYDEAILSASRAIELRPNEAVLYAVRAVLASHGEGPASEAVAADLRRASELSPRNNDYRERYIEHLCDLGKVDDAIAFLDDAIAKEPASAALYFERGRCKCGRDEILSTADIEEEESEADEKARLTAAIADLEKALKLGHRDEDVHWELIRAHESLRDEAGRTAEIERAIEAFSDSRRRATYATGCASWRATWKERRPIARGSSRSGGALGMVGEGFRGCPAKSWVDAPSKEPLAG